MAGRAAGEGTVYRTPNGRWIAQLELPRREAAKRRRVWRRAATKREAQEILRELKAEFYRSGGVTSGRRTIEDAVGAYLNARRSKPLSDATHEHDEWLAGLLADGLGAVRLEDLTVKDCDDYLIRCADGQLGKRRPVGRKQIGRVRRFVVNVLTNEIRLGHLSHNVAQASEIPDTYDSNRFADEDYDDAGDRRALSVGELQSLIDVAIGARLVLFDLTGRNALRPGEARSLRWADLDLDTGELSVTGQQDRSNRRTRTKRRVRNARRTISIDQVTRGRLLAWKEEQEQMRTKAGPLWIENDVVASADWAGTSEEMISRVYRHRLKRVADLRPDGW